MLAAAALASAMPSRAATGPEASRTPASPAGELERYVIVAGESQALYRAGEVFLRFNRPNRAVGVTRAVRGEILVDRRHPSASRVGTIQVDISQLTSDEPRRDRAIRERWLESARFPIAEFRATGVEGLPDSLREGQRFPVVIHGDLKVREVTRRVTFRGSFVLEGAVLRGTASTTLRMTDFGFEPPNILGMLRVDDEVEVQVDIVARRAD